MEEENEEFVEGLKATVVGREIDTKKDTYKYIVQLECKYKIWKGRIMETMFLVLRSYYEFYILYCVLKEYAIFCHIDRRFLFIPLLPEIDHEIEIAANQSKLIKMQNELEKWIQLLQLRPDILYAEEFQDFLNLSQCGIVELRLCKNVFPFSPL